MAFDFFIPLATFPEPTPQPGLRRAIDFAAAMGGRVTAQVHEIELPPINSLLGNAVLDIGGMAAEAEARSRSQGAELVAELARLAEFFKLPFQSAAMRSRPELAPERMAEAARCHDYALVVPAPDSVPHRELAESVIFGSGGPVVLFPAAEVPVHLRTVVIGWDGSRAAARGVRDALPALQRASNVVIATFSGDKPVPAERVATLATYLGGHGIETTHVEGTVGSGGIGDALQDLALAREAGLLVIGAYGHSRLRDFVLGGATRSILRSLRLPVLLSH